MTNPTPPSAPGIDLSADDYAKAAATDHEFLDPTVTTTITAREAAAEEAKAKKEARTHQSEEAFLAEKASYEAKIDGGDVCKEAMNP